MQLIVRLVILQEGKWDGEGGRGGGSQGMRDRGEEGREGGTKIRREGREGEGWKERDGVWEGGEGGRQQLLSRKV